MARKRKSRVAEAPREPQPEPENLQPAESEIESEKLPEPEPDPETETTLASATFEENPDVEEEVVEDEEDLESEGEEADDGGIPENTDGNNDGDATFEGEKTEQKSEIPSLENGESNSEREDELEEENLEKLLEPFSKDQLKLLFKEVVTKHPGAMESLLEMAGTDPAHCKIFVHGLGWDSNAETLTSVFGKYGEIVDCKVVKDKNSGKSKGYAFILFKHRNGARRAMKQPQKLIEGRMTSCQLASAGPVQASPASSIVAASSPNVSEYTQRKIYVSNVSPELDPSKIHEFFSRFGEIEEGPLGLDKQTGKPKGFCLFVYKSFESAKRALEEPHKNYEGHILHCERAIDGPKHGKGFFNQQQQHHQHQHQHHMNHQGYYRPAKKGRFSGSGPSGRGGGHMMAPGTGPGVGFNPAVAPAAIGQAMAALLASQGAGLGVGNFLGGIGPGVNMQVANNAGYGAQPSTGAYGAQAGMQGGYGGQFQIGPSGARPHQGGAPYMGRGH